MNVYSLANNTICCINCLTCFIVLCFLGFHPLILRNSTILGSPKIQFIKLVY